MDPEISPDQLRFFEAALDACRFALADVVRLQHAETDADRLAELEQTRTAIRRERESLDPHDSARNIEVAVYYSAYNRGRSGLPPRSLAEQKRMLVDPGAGGLHMTIPFDPAEYLDTEESIAAYLDYMQNDPEADDKMRAAAQITAQRARNRIAVESSIFDLLDMPLSVAEPPLKSRR